MKRRVLVNRLLGGLLGLIVVVGGGCITISCCRQQDKAEKEERQSVPTAALTELFADTSFGSITVGGEETDRCEVVAKITAQACSAERAQEILGEARLKLEPDGEKLKVYIDKPGLHNNEAVFASFEITLPSTMQVNCQSSFGKITLARIRGDVEAHTSFDAITAEDLTGAIRLDTSYGKVACKNITPTALNVKSSFGPIQIDCSEATVAELQADINTSYGDIDFRVAPGFSGQVCMGTSFGNIKTELPITVQGEIKEDSFSGQIGQGKGKLVLTTSFGSIRLK